MNLLQASAIDTVMHSVFSTSAANRASALAGHMPCNRSEPQH